MDTDAHEFGIETDRSRHWVRPMWLGSGFLEKRLGKGIEPAACIARWERSNHRFHFAVCYKGHQVGEYFSQCVDRFTNEHLEQCINCLKASGQVERAHPEMDSSLLLTQLLRRHK